MGITTNPPWAGNSNADIFFFSFIVDPEFTLNIHHRKTKRNVNCFAAEQYDLKLNVLNWTTCTASSSVTINNCKLEPTIVRVGELCTDVCGDTKGRSQVPQVDIDWLTEWQALCAFPCSYTYVCAFSHDGALTVGRHHSPSIRTLPLSLSLSLVWRLWHLDRLKCCVLKSSVGHSGEPQGHRCESIWNAHSCSHGNTFLDTTMLPCSKCMSYR